MKKIPDPGKFSVSPLYKRASVKLMHMGMFPVPLLDNQTAITNGGGLAKFINKHSQNIAECRQLFDFLAEQENLQAYYNARTDLVTAAFSDVKSACETEATQEILKRSRQTPCVMFTRGGSHISIRICINICRDSSTGRAVWRNWS